MDQISTPVRTPPPGRDYYEVLGLSPQATGADVAAAYWSLARRRHALAAGDRGAAVMLDELNEAAEVLGTPALRRGYDAARQSGDRDRREHDHSIVRAPHAIAKRVGLLVMLVAAAGLASAANSARRPLPGVMVTSAPVIFFGDSITSGAGASAIDRSFAGLLRQRLDDAGFAGSGEYDSVISALGGQAVDLRFAQDVGRAPRSIIVVEVGAHSVVEDGDLSPGGFRTGYGLMLDCLQGTGAQVVVSTIPTLGWATSEPLYARADDRSHIIREEAGRRGIPVADVWQAMKDRRDLLSADNFHPGDAGHALIADLYWREIEPLLGKTRGEFHPRCDYDRMLEMRTTPGRDREGRVQ